MWNQSRIGGIRDPGIGQNRSQTGAAIGERGQLGIVGSAHRLKAAPDQHRDVGIGPRDGAEDLSASVGSLDIADPNFQMPFAVVAATDESRVQADGDRRRGGRRLNRGGVTKLLTDLERMAAQCLGALAGLDRQKMRQHASGDAKGHQGGKMRSQLIQLRRRPTMRWPADTSLGAATAGAAKPRKPHRHRAEQRRDLMQPPILDVTSPAAGRAIRPQCRMIIGLRGHHRLLYARQSGGSRRRSGAGRQGQIRRRWVAASRQSRVPHRWKTASTGTTHPIADSEHAGAVAARWPCRELSGAPSSSSPPFRSGPPVGAGTHPKSTRKALSS